MLKFKKEIGISVKTKDDYNKLMKLFESNGVKFQAGKNPTTTNYFKTYEEKTVIYFNPNDEVYSDRIAYSNKKTMNQNKVFMVDFKQMIKDFKKMEGIE